MTDQLSTLLQADEVLVRLPQYDVFVVRDRNGDGTLVATFLASFAWGIDAAHYADTANIRSDALVVVVDNGEADGPRVAYAR